MRTLYANVWHTSPSPTSNFQHPSISMSTNALAQRHARTPKQIEECTRTRGGGSGVVVPIMSANCSTCTRLRSRFNVVHTACLGSLRFGVCLCEHVRRRLRLWLTCAFASVCVRASALLPNAYISISNWVARAHMQSEHKLPARSFVDGL